MIPIIMLFFALGGSLMGMAEEALVYVPLFIPLALAVGFDTITGTAMVGTSRSVRRIYNGNYESVYSWAGSRDSGSSYVFGDGVPPRFIRSHICNCCYIRLSSCDESKEDPASGIYGKFDTNKQDSLLTAKVELTKRHKWILTAFLINYIILVFGVIKYEWYIKEIAALFIILTIIIAILGKISLDDTVESLHKDRHL